MFDQADLFEAIRGRRTIKAFLPEPVPPATLDRLFRLASWAPNHHLTNPWRFRVVGPQALEDLKAADPEGATKLDRAPTLVAVSAASDPEADDEVRKEDLLAVGSAAYIVLLAAHGLGLAGYWRTPNVIRTPEGRAALAIPPEEQTVGLLYLGHPAETTGRAKPAPPREPVQTFTTYLR